MPPMVLCYAERELGARVEIEAYLDGLLVNGAPSNIRLLVTNTGDCEVSRFTATVCGQTAQLVCGKPLQIGESKLFDVPFPAAFSGEEYLPVTLTVHAEDGSVLASAEYLLFIAYTDLSVQATVAIENGKQQFTATVANASQIASGYTLNVYVNGELRQERKGSLTGGAEESFTFSFEEIAKDDYVCFIVVADGEDYILTDNKSGMYSLQTERVTHLGAFNPYIEVLQNAKQAVV